MTPTSLAEYLNSTYEPDREYIAGRVIERNPRQDVRGSDHSLCTYLVAACFDMFRGDSPHVTLLSRRLQTGPDTVRVPDVALYLTGDTTGPPVLTVEVIHQEDTFSDTVQRAADYHRTGVGTVWLIDVANETACWCTETAWTYGDILEVTGTAIRTEITPMFSLLKPITLSL
jgi:hypothetical protein